jgi:ABC-type multidrug transport system fused ATPase/permease subunit
VTHPYEKRAAAHTAAAAVERRRSLRISRLRLLTFLPAAACVVWMLAVHPSAVLGLVAAALFVVFGSLVVRHARIEERIAWFDALRLVNERSQARLRRDWSGLPAAEMPIARDLTHHPYATDLDLFGRASVAQWLGPSATPTGVDRLASWLLDTASIPEIQARQAAVLELARADVWREQFFAHGVLISREGVPRLDRFFGWAEGPPVFGGREVAWRGLVVLLTLSIWILLALQITGLVDAALWMLPMMTGVVLSFVNAARIYGTFERAGAGQRALSLYAALLEHAVAVSGESERLAALRSHVTDGARPAPACMRQLNRILGFAELRSGAGIFHFLIQVLTLWDFHVVFALDRWRMQAGRHVRGWIEAVGELDALSSLANVAFDHPSWCTPEFHLSRELAASSLAHPLLPDDRAVANDVHVGPPGTVLVITGSNMSGKSTLLRAMGLNVVLAQAGAPACASSLRLPSCDLQASIRVQDSLELGLSYFMAALARLKAIVDAAEHERKNRVLLYLLDEILQGTNSVERSVAVRGVVRHLLDAGAIGAMTTHDLAVASQPPLATAARLVHFTETVDERGTMSFDYRLRPGLATSRNALRLMRMIGIALGPEE